MKLITSAALIFALTIPGFAQGGYQPFTVSASPSAQELTSLFTQTGEGLHDPFLVMRKIGSMGDVVVPALQAFLFDTPILRVGVLDPDGKTIDSVNAPPPNRLYGVMALDLIGTPLAYQVLASVAQSDSDSQVSGMALSSLAESYYYRAREDSLVPDKAVIGLLIQKLTDRTYVQQCGRQIGAIAREGLRNWTGVDYGEIPPDSIRVKEEERLGMTVTQYRLQQWKKNEANMTWDLKKGQFVMQP